MGVWFWAAAGYAAAFAAPAAFVRLMRSTGRLAGFRDVLAEGVRAVGGGEGERSYS